MLSQSDDSMKSLFWQVAQRFDGVAIAADLEVQQLLITGIPAHFSDHLSLLHTVAFPDEAPAVVRISAQHSVVVLDDDQLSITNQPIAAVDHLARGRSLRDSPRCGPPASDRSRAAHAWAPGRSVPPGAARDRS